MHSFLKLVVAGSLLFGCAVPVPAQTPEQDVDVIRTETDLTNLLFTVTDKNNRYITNIQQSDVRVLEDGVPQTLFTFQRETDRPLAIAFLIDVSGSEERTLPDEKAAARSFIENVIRSNKDQAAIIPFEGYAHLEQPLTRDVLGIYRVLERVEVAYPAYLGSAPPMTGISSGPGTVAPPREHICNRNRRHKVRGRQQRRAARCCRAHGRAGVFSEEAGRFEGRVRRDRAGAALSVSVGLHVNK